MATNNNDKKISQLQLATGLTGVELVPVVQDGVNKRITVEDLSTFIGGGGAFPPSGVILSVNGKTNPHIVLVASDVGAESVTNKNQPLGYCGLDATGKVPLSNLPDSLFELKGEWDASVNDPFLSDGVGNAGDAYVVSVAGTVDFGSGAIIFEAGDFVFYGSDGKYFRSGGSTSVAVASVNGKTGVVILSKDDIGLSNVDNTSDVDKPISHAVQSALDEKATLSSLATVATSGSYTDLSDTPLIPDLTEVVSDVADLKLSVDALTATLASVQERKIIVNEQPSGSVDGINKYFTLGNVPVAGSQQVFLNGILQEVGDLGDYTISGDVISFNFAPESGWTVFANYATEQSNSSPVTVSGFGVCLQWSASEQVYPFETASNGSLLYCKEVDMGFLTNGGVKSVPHQISSFDPKKIHSVTGVIFSALGSECASINSMAFGGNFCVLDSLNVNLHNPSADLSGYKSTVRLVYYK